MVVKGKWNDTLWSFNLHVEWISSMVDTSAKLVDGFDGELRWYVGLSSLQSWTTQSCLPTVTLTRKHGIGWELRSSQVPPEISFWLGLLPAPSVSSKQCDTGTQSR